jgi:hypothetical protein
VLKLVSIVRRKEASNAHPHLLHPAEIRFRMHKALLREGKEADAIKCLEAVTKADVTPKILFALARLHTTQRKSLRGSSSTSAISAAPGTRVINHFKLVLLAEQ